MAATCIDMASRSGKQDQCEHGPGTRAYYVVPWDVFGMAFQNYLIMFINPHADTFKLNLKVPGVLINYNIQH